CQQGNSNPRTF
nr:immunoglobulin light chain junction region [Macaca mulatta]